MSGSRKHTPDLSVSAFYHDEVSISNSAQFGRVIRTEHFNQHICINNS